jgi:hypothetical protein
MLPDTTTRTCKDCKVVKVLDCFETTTKDGRSRRAVCKPCYSAKKSAKAREASKDHDPESIPKPIACIECKRGPSEVEFKWRSDIAAGGWRNTCNNCHNSKGYDKAHRARCIEQDAEAYRRRNAEVHLKWAQANPEKIDAQQQLMRSDPKRRFKALVSSLRRKHGDSDDAIKNIIAIDEADELQAKMGEPCEYCDFQPLENTTDSNINGLDRVDPNGPYNMVNTVPCCTVCNNMKCIMCTDEFITAVRSISVHTGLTFIVDINAPRPKGLCGNAERRATIKDKDPDQLSNQIRQKLMCQECYLCGRAPAFGIDRVDATIGYNEDNCKPCCTRCNYMKKDFPIGEMLTHIMWIHEKTKIWVLRDTSSILKTNASERKPIAPIIQDVIGPRPGVIFPSISTAAKILKVNKTTLENAIRRQNLCCGHVWQFVSAIEYNKQEISYDDAMQAIVCLQEHKGTHSSV